MRIRWPIGSVVLILTVGAAAMNWAAGAAETPPAENANLPYSVLYNMAGVRVRAEGVPSATNREARLVIKSTLPGVNPEDIQLYIASTNGRIPVTVERDGTISPPIRDDLLMEDPFVVANQPKGTLDVQKILLLKAAPADRQEAFATVRDGDRAKARYAQLFRSLAAVPSTASQPVAGSQQNVSSVPMAKVIRFAVKGSQGNKLVIHREIGERSITSDSDGVYVIPYDPDLYRENPWVSWPVPSDGQKPTP